MMLDNSTWLLGETKEESQSGEHGLDRNEHPAKPTQLSEVLAESRPKRKGCTERNRQPEERNKTKEAELRSASELTDGVTAASNDL
jgi:hypothetical protein